MHLGCLKALSGNWSMMCSSGRLKPEESGYDSFIPAHSRGGLFSSQPPPPLPSPPLFPHYHHPHTCRAVWLGWWKAQRWHWNVSSFALSPHSLRFMIVVVRTAGWQRGNNVGNAKCRFPCCALRLLRACHGVWGGGGPVSTTAAQTHKEIAWPLSYPVETAGRTRCQSEAMPSDI